MQPVPPGEVFVNRLRIESSETSLCAKRKAALHLHTNEMSKVDYTDNINAKKRWSSLLLSSGGVE